MPGVSTDEGVGLLRAVCDADAAAATAVAAKPLVGEAVGLLLHVPLLAVNVSPTVGVPAIVGGAVLTGAASFAARPIPATAASASRETIMSAAAPLVALLTVCSSFGMIRVTASAR